MTYLFFLLLRGRRALSSIALVSSLLAFGAAATQAQNIPDVNFANAIRAQCPTCIDGSNNLTPAAASLTVLTVNNSMISSLSGISGFSSLQELYCYNNQLTNLPTLPSSLVELDCYNNQLTSLPTLPSSLKYLDCSNNQLTSLPGLSSVLVDLHCSYNQLTSLPTLPNSLRELYCDNNQLTSLPALPSTLFFLYCSSNQLTSLPVLPTNLGELDCSYNQLTSLPTLPSNLGELDCSHNQLTSLPTLPSDLSDLNCSHNPLTSLPSTLPSSLNELYCSNNQLTSLPELPSSLEELDCSGNQLTSLPELPSSLEYLDCSSNQLTSLPELPLSLEELNCSNNQITCIPSLMDVQKITLDDDKIFCLPGSADTYNASGTQIFLPECISPGIITQPSISNLLCSEGAVTLTAKATANGSMTVRWQRKGASDTNYSDIPGTSASYTTDTDASYTTPTLSATDNGTTYRAVFTASCVEETATDAVTVNVSSGTLIPDANFAAAIRAGCATCIDACNRLTPFAATQTLLSVTNFGIRDLTGIEGFSSLQYLWCPDNLLTTLPTLPSSLQSLICHNNLITCLPLNLPASLAYGVIQIDVDKILCIPSSIALTIQVRDASGTVITTPPVCGSPSIVTHPSASNPACAGSTASITAQATGNGGMSVRWQRKGASEANYSDIAGTSASYTSNTDAIYTTPTLSVDDNGTMYRAVFTNCHNETNTNGFTLSISTGILIPDANFAAAIRSVCPACIDDCNRLTPAAASRTSLNVSGSNISNLAGIEGFSALQTLWCFNNQLSTLPTLPSSLQTLWCNDNQLSSLPTLPSGLVQLYCFDNQISNLPTLPSGLEDLRCNNNQLSNLPTLPSGLEDLRCNNNQLSSLPTLPSSLKGLHCNNNQLGSLPTLPSGLEDLFCEVNQLSSLPTLPSTLVILRCDQNQLTSLPTLPSTLVILRCDQNQLTSLPTLPSSLIGLRCENNQIRCLPALPTGVEITLSLDADKILCLPNTITGTVLNAAGSPITLSVCGVPSIVTNPSSSSNVCAGSSVVFSARATGNGSMTVRWQRKGASEANYSNIAGSSTNYTTNTNTTYTVAALNNADNGASYRAVFSNCNVESSTNPATLTFSPPAVASNNGPLCVGSQLNLSVLGGTAWTWSGPNFSSNAQNPNRPNATTAMSGAYSVTVSSGNCIQVLTTQVTIRQVDSPQVTSNSPVCVGTTLRLSVTGASAGSLYSWGGPTFGNTTQNPTRPNAAVTMTGTYTVTVTGQCSSSVLTTSVAVSPNVAPSITSLRVNGTLPNAQNNTVAVCNTQPVNLNVTATNAVTYSWRGPTGAGSGFTSSLVSPVNMPISSPRQGQYTVTVRNGCAVFNQRVINIQLTNCATRLANVESAEDIEMKINAYPNPVGKTLRVEVRLKEAQPLQLKLLNGSGQASGTWQLSEPSTLHRTELDVSHLTDGVYLLEAQAGQQRAVKRVVKVQ